MIVLGMAEPRYSSSKRVIKRVDVNLYDILNGKNAVTITVPFASVVVTVDNKRATPTPTQMAVYYEAAPQFDEGGESERMVDVDIRAVTEGNEIPENFRCIGYIWIGSELIAIYAGTNETD